MLYEKVNFELNEEGVKQHFDPFGKTYFEPTTVLSDLRIEINEEGIKIMPSLEFYFLNK